MNFGWLEPEQLDEADLRLPPDPPDNAPVLGRAEKVPPAVTVGLAEWRVKEWMGRLYPKGTKDVVLMDAYIARYRCLEFNATHYRIYTPDEVRRWAGKAEGTDFQFLPKFPQDISHRSGFVGADGETADFLEGVRAFGEHLGPLFLQTSEWFDPSPARRQALYRYLAALPDDLDYFVEFRHPDWFRQPALGDWTAAFRDLGIGALITDTPGRRDVCHMRLTVPRTFVRFVAKARHRSTALRLDEWAVRLKSWMDAGLESCQFIVHAGLSAPEISLYTVDRFNTVCGLALPVPRLAAPLFDPFGETEGNKKAPETGAGPSGQTGLLF